MALRSNDAGNFQSKLISAYGEMMIPSNITHYRERSLDEERFGKYDLIVEYEDRKYFAGTLAMNEDEFADFGESSNMFGNTKAHEEAKLRTIISLALSKATGDVQLVVGQPIKKHKDNEKKKIIQMLKGPQKIIINDITYEFAITDVAVAAEGSSAYFAIDKEVREQHEVIRIIDAGSGTVNCGTIYLGKKTDKGSDTFNFGRNTIKTDVKSFAEGILKKTTGLKWNQEDRVFVCGGSAYEIINTIQNHYENAEVIKPRIQVGSTMKRIHPVYANAAGYYEIARGLYG
ncbi:plasmid segregation protein ParM [Evansella vedderi]|uniref:Plasmid segregation protein ParM n=1 Tax=Evansella vedderi TaxID=38282 RepID=A0ABU0A368_9BACI|nr:hypothetical protein [Evansella vedderi]MDQ0257932.1 plasmid segregation protein ParM [Evansella vedderi]